MLLGAFRDSFISLFSPFFVVKVGFIANPGEGFFERPHRGRDLESENCLMIKHHVQGGVAVDKGDLPDDVSEVLLSQVR